jgi:hypothetical protein
MPDTVLLEGVLELGPSRRRALLRGVRGKALEVVEPMFSNRSVYC